MREFSPFADARLTESLAQDAKRLSPRLSAEHKSSSRFNALRFSADGLTLDASRQRVDANALTHLFELAEKAQLNERIHALVTGDKVNLTEQRPALHSALRSDATQPLLVDGVDVLSLVHAERAKMKAYVQGIHDGTIKSHSGERFTDVVNIGIGGSDLGPVMVTEALKSFSRPSPRVHFVSAIDGVQWTDLSRTLNPRSTLILICSKTFTTIETLTNARLARQWLIDALGESALPWHVAAVSVNQAMMDEFGVGPTARFQMWDWVGGRYSVWSAIGLSAELSLGSDAFDAFLAGGRAMDKQLLNTPLERNLPIIFGLLSFWNRVVLNIPTRAVLPYDQRLHRLPAYLQQLTMESNGKSVRRNGEPVSSVTGAIYWGEPGNNGQHSFFQLLHQGTDPAALDIIFPIHSSVNVQPAQRLAIANALAQAEAFAYGYNEHEALHELKARGRSDADAAFLARHKVHPGGRPVNLLYFDALTPFVLGQLVALYEHQVYVESVLMDINPFDQWGVELGKLMAVQLQPAIEGKASTALRADLAELLKDLKQRGL